MGGWDGTATGPPQLPPPPPSPSSIVGDGTLIKRLPREYLSNNINEP